MKITSNLIIASVLVGVNSRFAAANASSSIRGNDEGRVLEEGKSGTFLVKDIEYPKGGGKKKRKGRPHQTMNVELENGLIYTLENVDPEWTQSKSGKGLKSGRAKIEVGSGAVVKGGKIDLGGGTPEVVEHETTGGKNGEDVRRLEAARERKLQWSPTIGEKTVLAVRVIAPDGQYGWTEDDLSDFVFGTRGDSLNLASGYGLCSQDQLTFRPADRFANGVVTITVDDTVADAAAPGGGNEGMMVNSVTERLNDEFGTSHPSQLADHILYCLPPGTMEGYAYAYEYSWLSVYENDQCHYPSTLMHEVGHNIGFGHSGEEDDEYGDQSSLMGYSYFQDDTPYMCFNGAKSWQSGWFTSASKEITPTGNGNTCFNGRLYGVADYDASNGDKTVIVKINDDRAGEQDFFVAFNRKVGANAGTYEGADQVLITTTGEEGIAFSKSILVAKLGEDESHVIKNFAGTTDDVVVIVDSINRYSDPGFAQIRIQYGGVACEETFAPTVSPSSSPTQTCDGKIVKVDVTTDMYPEETWWTLKNTCTDDGVARVVAGSSVYTDPDTFYSLEYCVPEGPYEFTIGDKYGDGMCCDFGLGHYSVQYGGTEVASGGAYPKNEVTVWGGNSVCCPSITRKRKCRRKKGTCTWSGGQCVNI